MKAIILVGGFGTRLKPITTNYPKSVIPFAGRPMVEWQIEALVKFGVKTIIFAIFYKQSIIQEFVNEMKLKYGVQIECSVEPTPLDTGGSIKLAESYLVDLNCKDTKKSENNTFFVLNSDIICDYPFNELYQRHLSHDGEITILAHPVEEPSRYGVIVANEQTGQVNEFIEKPKTFVGNLINAGIYIFNSTVFKYMPSGAFSLERATFPNLASVGKIYIHKLEGFWKDIGIPADFLECAKIYLNYFKKTGRLAIDGYKLIENEKNYVGINLVHKDSKVADNSTIGPYSVIHKNATVGAHSHVCYSIVMDGTVIEENSQVFNSILMFNVKIGRRVRVYNQAIIAENVVVHDDVLLDSKKIEPFQNIIC